jgi:5-methylcytosine-specific restriction endonuclease McrA
LFSPDRRASDGLQGACRPCCSNAKRQKYHADPDTARKRRSDYYAANKAKVLAANAKSREKNAEKVREHKQLAYLAQRDRPEFKERLRQYTALRAPEKRAYDAAYRAQNAERLDGIKKAWRARNADIVRAIRSTYKARRRKAMEGGDSSAQIAAWLRQQARVCFWCEADCADKFHIDHVMPLARGGKHQVANLCIACPRCNLRKNAKHPDNFRQEIERERCDIGMLS